MYEMVQENHRMLQSMRRSALISGIVKFVFWVIVLVVIPYFTFQYFQPYIQQFSNVYQEINGKSPSSQSSNQSEMSQIQKFFEQFGGTPSK